MNLDLQEQAFKVDDKSLPTFENFEEMEKVRALLERKYNMTKKRGKR